MLKFLITNPVDYHGEKHILAPLGPLCVATAAKEKGCKVFYQDAYLEDLSLEDFANKLLNLKPDIIGISCNAEDRLAGIKTAKIAKKTLPNSLIIMGGPFATIVHQEIIDKLNFVDIVVRHEGEETIKDIIDYLQNKKNLADILGITYRQNNQTHINPNREFITNLDDLPMPDFSLTDIHKYKSYLPSEEKFNEMKNLNFVNQKENKRPMANLIFSRGCPFDCIFCSAKSMWWRKLRTLSPNKAIDQVKYFVNQGVYDFVFQDDHLIADKNWFKEFAQLLQNLKQPIRYACLARIDSLDEPTAELIYKSGGRMITLGIENLSNSVLKKMNKKIDMDQTWRALEILKRNHIIVRGGVLIQTPGETLDDLSENIRQHSKLRKFLIQAGALRPLRVYPGSQLEKIALENNQLKKFSWVENYHNIDNCLLSSPPHIPIYKNLPAKKIIPHIISQALAHQDHYLSRLFIRENIIHPYCSNVRSWYNKLYQKTLGTLGIFKYLFNSNSNIFTKKISFLVKVFKYKKYDY